MPVDKLHEIIDNVFFTEKLTRELGAELKKLGWHLEDLREGPSATWADDKELAHIDSEVFDTGVMIQKVHNIIHKYLKKG